MLVASNKSKNYSYLYRVNLILPKMKFVERLNSWFAEARRKRRVAIYDNDDELWRADLSPLKATAIGVAVVTIVFVVLLLLVAYTPLLDLMPGYRTNAGRSREILVRSLVRIDSLERKVNDLITYNENRILVVRGKTPAMQSVQNDTLDSAKEFVAPSKADSLLRHKMENDENYRLNSSKLAQDAFGAVPPMSGIISEKFNSKDLLGVRINGAKDAQVSAIADGVVLLNEWSPEKGHCVVIQHNNNFVSLYRGLSSVLVSKGVQIKGSQAIGVAGSDKEGANTVLEFELWRDGKAVNPELYIIF